MGLAFFVLIFDTDQRTFLIIDTYFRSDCSRCAALCCVALSFEKSQFFAIAKQAEEPCPNLAVEGGCKIHDKRKKEGYQGCIQYDCLGAGQRVTQEVFAGQSWQSDVSFLRPMVEAFRVMRRIQELRQLLMTAKKLPLNDKDGESLRRYEKILTPDADWSSQSLSSFEVAKTSAEIQIFIKSLRKYLVNARERSPTFDHALAV